MHSCQTLSNAFDGSRKTPRTFNEGLASKTQKIQWLIGIINWFMPESFGLSRDLLFL